MDENGLTSLQECVELSSKLISELQEALDHADLCIGGTPLPYYQKTLKISIQQMQSVNKNFKKILG